VAGRTRKAQKIPASPGGLSAETIEAIVAGRHADPFAVLGVHEDGGVRVARVFVPHAEEIVLARRDGSPVTALTRLHAHGLFAGPLGEGLPDGPLRLHCANAGGHWVVIDPYSFGPVLGPMDDYYAAEGTHLRLFDRLGAHPMTVEGYSGTHFALWAPNAARVSVVGDFNGWDGRRHVMRKRMGSGLFEIFAPDVGPETRYKFEIVGPDGAVLPLKADPFAFFSELRPGTASRIADPAPHRWSDADYVAARALKDPRRTPISIYEAHLGSWRRGAEGAFLTWDELAETLIPYLVEMGFTHVECLPLSEHPLDASWGYQPTGLYAPTARFGEPSGLARFVDRAHAAGIGVILDWVPAHFPTDAHGLARFDGTALYEHEDSRLGYHPDWNTAIYNFGRTEVAAFLLNNALYWLERFHIDGLRVDAVASMLYLDYSRKHGEWVPNRHGGNENLDAVEFLKRMNATVYARHPGIVTIAEESTAWPGVSRPVDAGGLGFGFKWNMGFMHDTLKYLALDPIYRKHHHHALTFGLLYAFSENFVLPLSHDEVVHGKGSLLTKMAGDDAMKFAQLRAYYGFMWGYPGKKLLFMGQEFAQRNEWSEERGLDWHLLDAEWHEGVRRAVRDLNHLYRATPALHRRDNEPEGFSWSIVDDRDTSVFAWERHDGEGGPPALVISNFTPVLRRGYRVPFSEVGRWREAFNSDAALYGGGNAGNLGGVDAEPIAERGRPASALVDLPPLSTLIFVRER
jgi:1,4-alpha-glucan branching enzyme